MEIKVEDYLSRDEIREIISSEIRTRVAGDAERIVSNLAYAGVEALVDASLLPEHLQTIKDKIPAIIADLSSFNVFRKKDAWDGEDSIAYVELQKAMAEHKHLISERVKQVILDHDFERNLRKNEEYFLEMMIEMMKKAFSQ